MSRWVTPDKKVIEDIVLKYPGSGSKAGPQFRVRDIHKHWLGDAHSVAELVEKFGIDLATLEEIT